MFIIFTPRIQNSTEKMMFSSLVHSILLILLSISFSNCQSATRPISSPLSFTLNPTFEEIEAERSAPLVDNCLPQECIEGYIFDFIECRCVPGHEPSCPPRFMYDPVLCRCVCAIDKPFCPKGFIWDEKQCKCICAYAEICKPGFIWSDRDCSCVCNVQKDCKPNFYFDPLTCDCLCDEKNANKTCPPGMVFDFATCGCVNGVTPSCPPGFIYDPKACDCVCEKVQKCSLKEVWDGDICKCVPIRFYDEVAGPKII